MDNKENKVINTTERLATAQWILERHLGWIAAAEIKVGVIVAINTALLGGLAAAFNASHSAARIGCTYIFVFGAAGTAILALVCAAMAVLPRTNGPKDSLLFFGPVAKQDIASYRTRFRQATDEALLSDWVDQIHRNAEIARDKYLWVRRSMVLSFVTVIPWVTAIGLLVKF